MPTLWVRVSTAWVQVSTAWVQVLHEEFLQLNEVGSPDGGTGAEDHGFEPPARLYPGYTNDGLYELAILAADYKAADMPSAATDMRRMPGKFHIKR